MLNCISLKLKLFPGMRPTMICEHSCIPIKAEQTHNHEEYVYSYTHENSPEWVADDYDKHVVQSLRSCSMEHKR